MSVMVLDSVGFFGGNPTECLEPEIEHLENLRNKPFRHRPVNSWSAVSPGSSLHKEFDSTSAWRTPGPRSDERRTRIVIYPHNWGSESFGVTKYNY